MRTETLLELIEKWEREVEAIKEDRSAVEDGPNGLKYLHKQQGKRLALEECVIDLRRLIEILG